MKIVTQRGHYHTVPVGIPDSVREKFVTTYGYQNPKKADSDLLLLNDNNLHEASPSQMWELIHTCHPSDWGYDIARGSVIREYERRGEEIHKSLQLPFDMEYPYVNVHSGYKAVHSLGDLLEKSNTLWNNYWSIHEHYYPVPEIGVALKQVRELLVQNTNKPKRPTKLKYAHEDNLYYNEFNHKDYQYAEKVLSAYLDKYGETATIFRPDSDNFLLFILNL